jgi:hypothetical protein
MNADIRKPMLLDERTVRPCASSNSWEMETDMHSPEMRFSEAARSGDKGMTDMGAS